MGSADYSTRDRARRRFDKPEQSGYRDCPRVLQHGNVVRRREELMRKRRLMLRNNKRAQQPDLKIRQVGRRERNKAEKKERVLKAARELFAKNGFENTSMKAISDRANVGFGTLFLIADSKRDLLFKLFQSDVLSIRTSISDKIDYEMDVTDIFSKMLYGYFELFSKNIDLSRDYIREITFASAPSCNHSDIHFGEFFVATAQSVLNELKRQGRIKEDIDISVAAETLYSTFMGAIRIWLRKDNPNAQDGKAYLRSAYEIVVFGIS